MFDTLFVDLPLKRNGRDLLNRYDPVSEKVVDNEELMESSGGNAVREAATRGAL